MMTSVDVDTWPLVSRTLHLPGGLRVEEIEPGIARFGPFDVGAGGIEISIQNYASIGNDQREVTGLPVLGCEFFRSTEELQGFAQPNWRPIIPSQTKIWPTEKAEINWSGLANAARGKGQMRTFLVAGAITSQCRLAAMRLLDLSHLYLKNLNSYLKTQSDTSEERFFRGYFYDALISSIHAAFTEIATLRDYIAEYISLVVYVGSNDSMDSLYRFLMGRGFHSHLEKEIENINAPNGWLKEFSELRNTVAHRMPFDRLAGSGLMQSKHRLMPNGQTACLLHVPVPVAVPKNHKTVNLPPADEENYIAKMLGDMRASSEREDTLVYLFDVFGRLIDFGNRLDGTFPYPPVMFTTTDDMIISASIEE